MNNVYNRKEQADLPSTGRSVSTQLLSDKKDIKQQGSSKGCLLPSRIGEKRLAPTAPLLLNFSRILNHHTPTENGCGP